MINSLFFVVGLVLIAQPSYPGSEQCNGFAKPEAVYLAYVDAVNKRDWELAYSYIAASKRVAIYQRTILGLLVASSFDEELSKELDPILIGRGFTVNHKNQYTDLESDLKKVDDWPGLMKQIAILIEKHGRQKFANKESLLTDVKIVNNLASGMLRKNGDETILIRFIKTDNGWCLAAVN